MYQDKIKLQCVQHGLAFEYPRNYEELFLSKPRCSLCQREEVEKLRGRLEEMQTQRDRLAAAIEIKNNIEIENA